MKRIPMLVPLVLLVMFPVWGDLGLDWSEVTGSANWSVRQGHSALAFNGKLWIIGGNGSGENGVRNDVWYSTDGATWSQATASAPWRAREYQTAVVFKDRMWLMGGTIGHRWFYEKLNDVWSSPDGQNWSQVIAAAPWGRRQSHASVVYDGKIWIFGGWGDAIGYNDVWSSEDGVGWTMVTAAAPWGIRDGHSAVVFDNKMWVIAGAHNKLFYSDAWWSTDGQNWHAATESAAFGYRKAAACAVLDGRIWLIAGQSNQGVNLNDVWYSDDGAHWVRGTAAAPWVVRVSPAATAFQNKLFLLGGMKYEYFMLNDVWSSSMEVPSENHPPIAEAGGDQTVYVDSTGYAAVTLDGSGSSDPDGDSLTYNWYWTQAKRLKTAEGVNPTLQLPVGTHKIALVVNDGEEDSEISFVQIRVLGDLKVWLHITPGRFSSKKPPRVLVASIRFPKGIQKSQIDTSMPLRLMPLNLLSTKMKLYSSPNHAWIEASFKPTKEQIRSLARGKEVPMTVTGKIKSGRKFSGVDKVFVK